MAVDVSYHEKSNTVRLKIRNSNSFSSLIQSFKATKCKYNPKEKVWEIHPSLHAEVFSRIDDLDVINISPETRKIIESKKNVIGETETVFRRMPLNEELLKLPPIVGKPPYEDYQIECIQKGIQQNRMALFLPVGSGKTYVATSILNHFFERGSVDRLLIVAPSEGVINWKRELQKFSTFADESDVCVSLVDRNRNPLEDDPKIIVTTYRHFLTISDDFYKQKNKGNKSKNYRNPTIPFDEWGSKRAVIFDESHKIKNPKARISKVALLHARYFDVRLALTGTPTPNTFDEIYTQMKFLDSKLMPDYYAWLNDVAILGTRFSQYQIAGFKRDKVKEWEDRLDRWVVKYNAKDILDLPELYEKKIYASMSEIQTMIYEEVVRNVLYKIKEEYGRIIPIKVRDYFPYLRLAVDNPELLKGRTEGPALTKLLNRFKFERDHNKVEIVESLLEEHEGEKVILFDYHPLTLEMLSERLKSRNPLMVHGSNTPNGRDDTEWREEQYDLFRKEKHHNLLIASSKVLTTSANLQEANVLIYFSRDYSYLTYEQSKARAHRLGQQKTVFVYPLIFDMCLDETIDRAIDQKEELNRTVFSNATSLTKQQWEDFFKGKSLKGEEICKK